MPDSIAEQIAAKVATRLASTTGVSDVVRPTKEGGFQPKDYQIIVTQDDISIDEALACPGNPPATAWVLPFQIVGVLRPSELSTVAIAKLKNEFWAAVVSALCGVANWWTWDGLAIDSRHSGVVDYTGEDGSNGFVVTLNVTFRTDENNPFNLRG